jgi:hypothetical protein
MYWKKTEKRGRRTLAAQMNTHLGKERQHYRRQKRARRFWSLVSLSSRIRIQHLFTLVSLLSRTAKGEYFRKRNSICFFKTRGSSMLFCFWHSLQKHLNKMNKTFPALSFVNLHLFILSPSNTETSFSIAPEKLIFCFCRECHVYSECFFASSSKHNEIFIRCLITYWSSD